MTLAEIVTRHFGGDWHGSYGAIPTPDHSKHDRGTTVKDAADGSVIFNSFNGGDWRQLKEECERAGILPDRERVRAGAEMGERETGRYEFRDEHGAVLYRTRRIEKPGARKRYVAERPDGAGRWTAKLGDVRRVLYRLPELSAAISRAALKDEPLPIVYLVEGERKADKLAGWGFTATAIAFGARGGIGRPEYIEPLRGCRVVILPDNDDEGRAFAEAARVALGKGGDEAVILSLPGLPEKGDVIDWTGTADELRSLTEAALNPPAETFPIADLTAWARTEPTAKSFAMAGCVPEREVTLFTGAGGTNKSTFGLQLCACAAAALPLLGIPVASGAALYVTAEDEDRENHWRLRKIADAIGTTLDRLAGRLHVVSLRGRLNNELATFDGEGKLHTAPAFRTLRATIEATGSRLIVLDNVAHLFVGNENDRGQVTAFVNLLYSLCRDLGCSIVLIGHPNKTGDSYSGSTAWLNAVRSQIVLGMPEGNPDPDARVLTLGKANYARADQQIAFRWHDFALVRDEDLSADMRAAIAANVQANAENDAFLRCLAATTEQHRAVSHVKGSNYAPTIFARMTEAAGLTPAAFERAMEGLLHLGRIKLDQPLWRGENRHWKQGIVCADPSAKSLKELAPTPAFTPCADPRQPPDQVIDNTAPTLRAPTPLYTTYKTGAASRPAAPVPEKRNGPILAPGESDDDPVPGWEDER